MAILEVCVDTIEGAIAAAKGGADRIELCSALSEGGLTPSLGLMQAAAQLSVPCYAMIRPRGGMFHYSTAEVDIMRTDIAAARNAGLHGVVLGAQNAEGALDISILKELVTAAGPLGKTMHRVIDVVPDPLGALRQAIDLGFDRVLTSGAQQTAPEGAALIRKMMGAAKTDIIVMPGAGLNADNICDFIRDTGAAEIHASCRVTIADTSPFGFTPPNGHRVTSASEVARLLRALNR